MNTDTISLTDAPGRRAAGSARFRAVCAAAGVSSVGDGAVYVAFPLVAASLTHDPRAVAAVAVAQRLPWLCLSLLTGALADRLDRRRMLGASEFGRMITLALLGLALSHRIHPLAALAGAAFALGTFETAFQAASTATIPALVPEDARSRANGRLYAVQMSGEGAAGPALGGLLVVAALALPFLVDGVSFAFSGLILLMALPRRSPAAARPSRPGVALGRQLRGIAGEMREGLSWFLSRRAVRLSTAYVAGLAFCQSAVFAVLVLWARQDLHVSPAGYGLLITLSSLGLVGAAAGAGRLYDRLGPAPLLLAAGAVSAGAYLVLAATGSRSLAALAMLAEGAAVSTGNVVSATLRQKLIPQHLLGRVSNVMRTCIFGAMPLGSVAGGVAAGVLGLRGTLLVAALAQGALVVALGGRLAYRLRLVGLAVRRPNAASWRLRAEVMPDAAPVGLAS